jgi:antitoxin ParD1/3/4
MNISLTPELEKMIQRKVKTGNYNNASEVIREALRLLQDRDREKEIKLEILKSELKKGIDQLDHHQYGRQALSDIVKKVKKRT